MLSTFISGISAGVLIAIGGTVFLSCDSRYAGALLFAVALLCICWKGYYLFTGKIGYVTEDHSAENVLRLVVGLAANLLTTLLLGLLLRYALPNIGLTAEGLCAAKLQQSFLQTLIRASFCGILMYLAVSVYREQKTVLGIVFCIPVFILSGFEHSIADMFYFGAAGKMSFSVIGFIAAVVLGNTLGSVLLPLLNKGGKPREKQ